MTEAGKSLEPQNISRSAPSPGICGAAVVDCRGGRDHRPGARIAGRMGASAVIGYLGCLRFFSAMPGTRFAKGNCRYERHGGKLRRDGKQSAAPCKWMFEKPVWALVRRSFFRCLIILAAVLLPTLAQAGVTLDTQPSTATPRRRLRLDMPTFSPGCLKAHCMVGTGAGSLAFQPGTAFE